MAVAWFFSPSSSPFFPTSNERAIRIYRGGQAPWTSYFSARYSRKTACLPTKNFVRFVWPDINFVLNFYPACPKKAER